jgi:hypothetical protein
MASIGKRFLSLPPEILPDPLEISTKANSNLQPVLKRTETIRATLSPQAEAAATDAT